MFASRHGHGALGQTTKTAWVCLRCRTKQQQQRRGEHTSTATNAIAYDGQEAVKTITHGWYGSHLDEKRNAARRPNQEQHGARLTFAEYVHLHTGKDPKDLPLLVKKWYRYGFANKPPGDASSPGTRSLESFISTRTDKTIHQLTGQELEAFIKDHRELQKRRRATVERSVDLSLSASEQVPGVLVDISEVDAPGSFKWRTFTTEKGEDPASQALFAKEDGATFLVRKRLQKSPNSNGQNVARARLLSASRDQARSYWEDAASIDSANTNVDVLQAVTEQLAQHELQEKKTFAPERLFRSRSPSSIATSKTTLAWQTASPTQQVRAYHISRRVFQQTAAARAESSDNFEPVNLQEDASAESPEGFHEKPGGIRAQLRQWQELHGHEELMPDVPKEEGPLDEETPYNSLTRLPNEQTINQQAQKAAQEDDRIAFFEGTSKEGFEGSSKEQSRFLASGDLVELEFMRTERESMMAIYIRRVAKDMGQYLTLTGRWIHMRDAAIPYSVTGWIDPKMLEPLLKHLPDPQTADELDLLKIQAYTEDLDVPREISGPLVARLQAFTDEVREIYRRNASALDDAHNMLAHETDLRYGSLVSAATALLKIPADKLPLTALFTVRKALANGGFAFNIDRRSHRLTGYMQIRSKEQVRMVEHVRTWIRHWQDDLAIKASMDEFRAQKHKPNKGAQILYSFIAKSRQIIAKQRQNREPSPESGNVGPSKTRLPIRKDRDCVQVEAGTEFTEQETEVVKFMEAWCCSSMFTGLTRIESLPPLILHALGLYPDTDLKHPIGYLFLQELGTIVPHENRVRFDQHLLLPSSQHSKPLQNLMTSLMAMKDNHNLRDSMADLRHDWKHLPVYCIDDVSAQEIDDGVSIEDAGIGANGKQQHWLHIHIANPTAFFSRDHPLAKMARHMGETLYMPERTYMMLPRWATSQHFSLAPNRPCLTFSAKIDSDGNTLETKVISGTIRNVIRITYDEVEELVGGEDRVKADKLTLTVGGTPPPPRASRPRGGLTEKNHSDLHRLMDLAVARSAVRRRAGGIFFEQHHPDITVWQNAKGPGLAWDHPHRKGSRTMLGDPIIQLRSQPLQNWFTSSRAQAQVLVSEAMLLCSEIAAKYCADRQIPTIYRGTISTGLLQSDHPKTQQWQGLLAQGRELPMYLGVPYLKSLGYTVLRTQPLKHAYLGMDHYAKVTSPLRRYGDMILHWQIEAALKHEAATGQSMLIQADDTTKHDRSFLPFSTPVLETIMLGLQPRETMITRAKRYSNDFWAAMLIFRMFHYKEGGFDPTLPQGQGGFPFEKLTVFIQTRPDVDGSFRCNGTCIELSLGVEMWRPEHPMFGLEQAVQGDVWEVELDRVDVYNRRIIVKPTRLVGREGL